MGILPDFFFNPQNMAGNGGLFGGMLPFDDRWNGASNPTQLPFADRWNPAAAAVANGQFDPQTVNFNQAAYSPMAGGSPPPIAQGAPNYVSLPPNIPMPQPRPPDLGQQPMAGPAPEQQPQYIPGPSPAMQQPQPILQPSGFKDRLMSIAGILNPEVAQQYQQQQTQGQIYQALKASGIPEAQARAASLSPELLKTIAPEHFSGWKIVKTGSSPITGDQFMMQGPGGQLRPLDSFTKGGGESGSGVPGSPGGMLAQGVKQYNPNLTGEEYLAQFGPEVQSAVKAYMKGDVMPTGNPRLQGIAAIAKTIAQKYGTDIGQPVSDALYSERRKYRTELGSNSATTAGGQAKAFVQGIEHADALATKLEGLKNWNGLGIPLLAAGANTIRQAFSNNQSGLAAEAQALGQTLAGEVGKLFSGSAGGGVHEREMTRQRFKTISSGPELAGALEGTLETMEGGLRALESRRDQVLGPNSDVKFITEETEKKMAHIREIIARLKSGEAPSPQPAPAVDPAALAEARRRGLIK